MLVAGPVYSPSSISRFSAVTLEVEGRVGITCRHPCRHPCGFSDSFRQCFCVSIRAKPRGAALEPLAKTKQPQQRCDSARLASAALGVGVWRGSDRQTAVWLTSAVPCSRCVLLVSLLSTCLTPCSTGHLGFVLKHRTVLTERRCRARRTTRASLKSWGESSGVGSLVLWFCST